MAQDIWVFVEQINGIIRRVSYELLSASSGFAQKTGGTVAAVLLGKETDAMVENLEPYAERIYSVEDEKLEDYTADGYTDALANLAKAHSPAILLAGSTSTGRDLFPRLAMRLETGLASDCTNLEIDDDGRLLATRPIYGGKVFCQVKIPRSLPQMATVRPNSFATQEINKQIEIIKTEGLLQNSEIRQRLEGREKVPFERPDVAEAEVVVSVGRGIKDPANFKIVAELADSLGASIGVTRAVVDNGWWDVNDQIGKSGKNTSARLYFAFGISGAIHHVLGIQTCKTVVAVNTDPNALIFNYADYGLVGDMMQVIPVLNKEISKLKSEI